MNCVTKPTTVPFVDELVTVKIHCPYSMSRPTRYMLCAATNSDSPGSKDHLLQVNSSDSVEHHDLSESDGNSSEASSHHGDELHAVSVYEDLSEQVFIVLPTGLEKIPYSADTCEAAIGKDCAPLEDSTAIRLKLGGVCCDVSPAAIVHLIRRVTGVSVLGIDLFTRKHGCCSVWVRDTRERHLLEKRLNERLWMGPPSSGFAVIAHNATAAANFAAHLAEIEIRHASFPRHLMTVSEYLKYPPNRRQAAHRPPRK